MNNILRIDSLLLAEFGFEGGQNTSRLITIQKVYAVLSSYVLQVVYKKLGGDAWSHVLEEKFLWVKWFCLQAPEPFLVFYFLFSLVCLCCDMMWRRYLYDYAF